MLRRLPRALVLAVVLAAVTAAEATVVGDFCAPAIDPCTINVAATITPGSVLDAGTRALVLGAGANLTVTGTATFRGRSVTLDPGAKVLGMSATGSGGDVLLRATGDIWVRAAGSTRARIDVSGGGNGGTISLRTTTGAIRVDGQLTSNGTATYASGGTIDLQAHGDVIVDGDLAVTSGSQGGAGDIGIVSDAGSVDLAKTVNASGGDVGGGVIDLQAAGNVVTRQQLGVSGGGISGDGGFITILADGDVSILGPIAGTASGDSYEGGGAGADLDVLAFGSITLAGTMNATGGFPDGDGGAVTLDAGLDVLQTAPILAYCDGLDSCGGEVDVLAGRNATLAKIDIHGGNCGGGSLFVDAAGTASIATQVNADGTTGAGPGGLVDLTAGTLSVSAVVQARGSSTAPAGVITASGCTVNIAGPGELRTNGIGGLNLVQAGGQMTIAGYAVGDALTGANRFEYLDPAQLPTYNPARVTPAPVVVRNLALAPCPGVVPTTTTTVATSSTTTSSTTTTSTSATSTTSTVTSTTTSSTLTGATTTTTASVSTTTTTTLATTTTTTSSSTSTSTSTTTTTVPAELAFAARGAKTGCYFEWRVRNLNGEVSGGFPERKQTCVDGDPACDGDSASDGVCTFDIRGCVAARDPRLPECQPSAVAYVKLDRPSVLRSKSATDLANAGAIANAIKALGVELRDRSNVLQAAPPVVVRDLCTGEIPFRVPHADGVSGRGDLLASARDTGRGRMRRNRVQLVCVPNTAVCGNGIEELGEACDDGNTVPCDGCSATCRLERCGNGRLECGEGCDDGNVVGCDGCSPTCQVEACGNGAPDCGETCDDGNTEACDGCSATCRAEACGNGVQECSEQCDDGVANGAPDATCSASCFETPPRLRVPGGGSKPLDCGFRWALAFGPPAVDRAGRPRNRQLCIDGDPACDFDPTPGTCGLRVWACAAGEEPAVGCQSTEIAELRVLKPTPKDVANAPLRADVEGAIASIGVPVGPGEVCSRRFDIPVPVGRKLRAVGTRAVDARGGTDRDTLKLGCRSGG